MARSGGLENDVVAGIAFIELALDFLSEVVFFVFGFPVAVGKFVVVDEGAVDADRSAGALDEIFGNEGEFGIGALAAFGQEGLEGATDGSLMVDIELAELVQGLVVSLDGRMRRLE